MNPIDSQARLQAALDEVTTLLERHRVLETWTRNQAMDRQREVVEALVDVTGLIIYFQVAALFLRNALA